MKSQIPTNQIDIKPILPIYIPIFFGIISILLSLPATESGNFIAPIYTFLGCFIIYLYVRYIYKNTLFRVSADFIEYNKDYIFLKKNGLIKTSEIKEISISQNLLQRIFGLGSITLRSRITNDGDIHMIDILNHDKVAKNMKLIIHI